MKILFITNIIGKGIGAFTKSSIEAAHRLGMEYHIAANFNNSTVDQIIKDEHDYRIKIHHVEFERNPLNIKNAKAFKQLHKLVKKENFDIIHCNTPVGGIAGRLIGHRNGVKRVIYQAHGFHFYKGAPVWNWILYYPVEKALARITDAVITINHEDFSIACRNLHPHLKVYYVPGVGIEIDKWETYKDIRQELGLNEKVFVIIVVGRLEKNKNCGTVIEAVRKAPEVKLVFCGDGEDRGILEEQAKDLGGRVIFLGNRSDMSAIYHMADCFILASYREGLSRSIMEAMACGLPCIVTDIRGNRDLIDKDFLFKPTDVDALAEKIIKVSESQDLRNVMKARNLEKIKEFSFERVVEELSNIYKEVFEL